MRDLGIFNTIRVVNPKELSDADFKDVRYGGFLTLSQSGDDENLIQGMRMAYKNNLTCFNVVNSENSPITNVIDQIQKEEKEAQLKEKATVLYDSSDEEEQTLFTDKNIGFYQKSGHCYSDVKSFIPQVVCMTLVSLWFSDKKQSQQIQSKGQKQDILQKRKQLVNDLGLLSLRMRQTLQQTNMKQYQEIAEFLKGQDNIFLLAKGLGSFVADYIAQKFNQIACIHAEAYPSAEFRHGPLSMLDEDEKTAAIFFVLDDENIQQVLANILQVKERGATVIVVSNPENIDAHINSKEKIDFYIQIFPQESLLSALLCTAPLLMVCYFTALAKGMNPDTNVMESINYIHQHN